MTLNFAWSTGPSQPEASVAQIAHKHGINNSFIFKWLQWLRLQQNEGRILHRFPTTLASILSAALLPVKVISAPTQLGKHNTNSCYVELY